MDVLWTFYRPDEGAYPTGQRARSRPTLLAALIIIIIIIFNLGKHNLGSTLIFSGAEVHTAMNIQDNNKITQNGATDN